MCAGMFCVCWRFCFGLFTSSRQEVSCLCGVLKTPLPLSLSFLPPPSYTVILLSVFTLFLAAVDDEVPQFTQPVWDMCCVPACRSSSACWLCSQQLHMMLNHRGRSVVCLCTVTFQPVLTLTPHPPPPTPKSCTWWCRTTSWWRSTFCFCVYHSSSLSFAGTGTPVARTYANVCWRFSTGIFSLASVLTGCGTTSWWRAMPPQSCVMSKHKLKEIHVLFLCTLTLQPVLHCPHSCAWRGTTNCYTSWRSLMARWCKCDWVLPLWQPPPSPLHLQGPANCQRWVAEQQPVSAWLGLMFGTRACWFVALFSTLEQTHCAHMWFYMNDKFFIARFFEYPSKWCTYSRVSWGGSQVFGTG